MCVLQVGQSAQYGLWSEEVMTQVHDTHNPFPQLINFFDLGSSISTFISLCWVFFCMLLPSVKLILKCIWFMEYSLLKSHLFQIALRHYSMCMLCVGFSPHPVLFNSWSQFLDFFANVFIVIQYSRQWSFHNVSTPGMFVCHCKPQIEPRLTH